MEGGNIWHVTCCCMEQDKTQYYCWIFVTTGIKSSIMSRSEWKLDMTSLNFMIHLIIHFNLGSIIDAILLDIYTIGVYLAVFLQYWIFLKWWCIVYTINFKNSLIKSIINLDIFRKLHNSNKVLTWSKIDINSFDEKSAI